MFLVSEDINMPIGKLKLFNVQLPTPNNKLEYIHHLKKKGEREYAL